MALNLPIGPGKFWTDAKAAIETWAAGVDTKLAQGGTSGPGGSGGIRNVAGTVNLDDVAGIVEVYATAAATVENVSLAAGDAAVFRYLSGAWTYMVVGEHTTWQAISLTPVTANVPTMNDSTNQITWTPKTGVQYVIGGSVRTSPYSVGDVTTSVTVTAQATSGYSLTGTSSWTFNFTGSGGGDTTAPTAGTLAVTGSGDAGTTRTLTVTGASDAGGLHAQPYRFSTNGGTTWSTYQSSNAFTTSALSAGTYQPRVMVRDAAGNTATASAADFTLTAPPASGLPLTDTFTAADGTAIVGRQVSGFTYELGTQPDFNMDGHTTAQIFNNAAKSNDGARSAVLDVAASKVRISGDVTLGATVTPIRLMISGGSTKSVYAFSTPAETKVYAGNGSTWVQVGATYAGGLATGATTAFSLEFDGTNVICKIGGVTRVSGPVTGLTGTKVGFSFSNTEANAAFLDNFTVEALP